MHGKPYQPMPSSVGRFAVKCNRQPHVAYFKRCTSLYALCSEDYGHYMSTTGIHVLYTHGTEEYIHTYKRKYVKSNVQQ